MCDQAAGGVTKLRNKGGMMQETNKVRDKVGERDAPNTGSKFLRCGTKLQL